MNCPICNSSEVYKRETIFDYFSDPPVETNLTHRVRFGKYDTPEPGDYECVDGHEWKVDSEGEIVKMLITA